MKIRSCRFERSAHGPRDEPRAAGPDVVFMGRANVGKSSLINRLLGVRNLARTSSRPGRTQSVNFYRVNEACYFVDLPGYGYSAVPREVRRSWAELVEGFLERRRARMALALLVVDARHSPSALDLTMRGWLVERQIPWLVAATKADKLSGNDRTRALRELGASFDSSLAGEPLLVSSVSGMGIKKLWRYLDQALAEAAARPTAVEDRIVEG